MNTVTASDGAARQGVFHHLDIDTGVSGLGAKRGHLRDAEPCILGGDRRLSRAGDSVDFGNDRLLLL